MPHEQENAPVPFDAQPAALHYRLAAVEEKIDNLPDELVLRLKSSFLTPEEHSRICSASKPPAPWDLGWLKAVIPAAILAGYLIGGALGLVPVPGTTVEPITPQVTAPK